MKKISWIVALLVALSFTILFSSCGEDKLAFLPSQGFELDLSGAVGVGGTVSGNTAKSFTFCGNGTAQYDDSFATFQVTLPKAIKNYSKISYDLVPLQGAVSYKAARVYGFTSQPAGGFSGWDQYSTTNTVLPITAEKGVSTGDGSKPIAATQVLTPTRTDNVGTAADGSGGSGTPPLTGNETSLWLVITIRPEKASGGKPTAYTVKNVRLLN